ncbi:hypothetical protein [Bacillus horti]|uniref:Uncharacterized protein n=1 Tax=Caldalkalibacillus horti TaxID=77523 RepID=A0ABT9W064_9BACI|nr:hypothetical protein [Bacillus horti]MDQ0166648.1 hypothetical protein [Bacillus horti]
MVIIKLTNIVGGDGAIDYKGLDLSLIVSGTQLYVGEGQDMVAYFVYKGDEDLSGDLSGDLAIITEEEYTQVKADYEEYLNNQPKPMNPEEEIQQLKIALAEIAEAHEQEKTAMKQTLSEIAEMIGGES